MKKATLSNKIVGFVYSHIIDFKRNDNVKGVIFSASFLYNVNCLIYSKNVIYPSHIISDIIGYAHSYCKVK